MQNFIVEKSEHNAITANTMSKATQHKVKGKRKLPKRKRYYGMTVVREGKKQCWLSSQNKNGWSLGLALNDRTVWLRNIRFESRKDVEAALKSKVVFVHLKHPVGK